MTEKPKNEPLFSTFDGQKFYPNGTKTRIVVLGRAIFKRVLTLEESQLVEKTLKTRYEVAPICSDFIEPKMVRALPPLEIAHLFRDGDTWEEEEEPIFYDGYTRIKKND